MRRCKNIYLCFIGAVFLLSLYNFVALSVVEGPAPRMPGHEEAAEAAAIRELNSLQDSIEEEIEEPLSREGFELEFEASNPHHFQDDGIDVGVEANELEEMDTQELPTPVIFWPDEVEAAIPQGTKSESWETCTDFRQKIMSKGINSTRSGSWTHCGRANNAYAVRGDGKGLCVRHRKPHEYYVAGDLLSYHLSQQLGLTSVPCVILDRVNTSLARWKVAALKELNWANGDVVAMIQWAPGNVRIPLHPLLLDAVLEGNALRWPELETGVQLSDQVELAQWSDLIVFDFLTGQYDRIASLQDEADKQKNPDLLRDNVRNMAVDSQGTFWVFDNEAGLLDAYILMYQHMYSSVNGTNIKMKAVPDNNHVRFQRFHQEMLSAFCVFRRSTIHAIDALYQQEDPVRALFKQARASDPLVDVIPLDSDKRLRLLKDHFRDRLSALIAHFKWCAETYG